MPLAFRGGSVTLVLAGVLLAACSGGAEPAAPTAAASLGPGEGQLNLLAFPGYVENGMNDSRVDWVTPFEKRTRCKVSIRVVETAEHMSALAGKYDYDGFSAPPELSGRLIKDGVVAPLNDDLIAGLSDLDPLLRELPAVRSQGRQYAVPYVWGTHVLAHDTSKVGSVRATWRALFEPVDAARGRLLLADSPLTIALAALYLRTARPELGIADPYLLTEPQLDAAVRQLRELRPAISRFWRQPTDAIEAFASGEAVLGQVSTYHVDVLARAGRPTAGVLPVEGTTGWLDAWFLSARAPHPNCMYQWLSWTITPAVQRQVAEWVGAAPANSDACALLGRRFCAAYHVSDERWQRRVAFVRTPARDCGGAGGECTDYAEWTRRWREIGAAEVPPPRTAARASPQARAPSRAKPSAGGTWTYRRTSVAAHSSHAKTADVSGS